MHCGFFLYFCANTMVKTNIMKRFSLLLAVFAICNISNAARDTYHVEVQRHLSHPFAQPQDIDVNMLYLAYRAGFYKAGDIKVSSTGTYHLAAEVWGSDATQEKTTYSTLGHWFHADGTPADKATDGERRVAVKFSDGQFHVTHRNNTSDQTFCSVGQEFRFAELLVNGNDTVRYEFHVTLVDDNKEESITSDQQDPKHTYFHRKDQSDDWLVNALLQRNDETPVRRNWLQVNQGDRITLSAELIDGNKYQSVETRWQKKSGTVLRDYANEPFVMTDNATTDLSGQYTLRAKLYLKGTTGYVTKTYPIYIDVQDNFGEALSWEGMLPTFGYNFKDEYGEIPAPQNILGEVGTTDRSGKPVNRVNGEWWTVCWGSNLNKEVGTDTATVNQAARNLIKKYDTDFKYIYDEMGWPPDIRARKGYKSTVYIFGSGLKCDNTSNTEKGGYQSAIWYNDPKTGIAMNWPCVWASYYPFSRFRSDADKKWNDGEYQREAMIHEGIHALFADMEGVKNSAWFHEAGNTWLQSAMNVRRSGIYGTPGFLDGCPFVAPFMPIECYSGWLQDGSFGGPSAEGVNMYNSEGQQICTWRTWLGGNQYGNSFPIILSVMCGDGSIPWIWRYCKNRVLEGIGDYIGDEAMRKLILQYRARQAVFDFGGWSKGYRTVANNYFGSSLGPEYEPYWIDCGTWKATCYQRMRPNDAEGWLAPDELVNPGWSGGNIIPIHVDKESDVVSVFFRPEDTEERAILCYRTRAGKVYYSQMVHCGEMRLSIKDEPANGVVFCVVANTDYKYTGDSQRKKHWDYRIRLGEGALAVADQHQRWYLYENTITDTDFETGIESIEDGKWAMDNELEGESLDNHLRLLTGVIQSGGEVRISVEDIDPTQVGVQVVGLQGTIMQQGSLSAQGTFRMPTNLRHGLYLLYFTYQGEHTTYKVLVK